jgi:hypothetical protein
MKMSENKQNFACSDRDLKSWAGDPLFKKNVSKNLRWFIFSFVVYVNDKETIENGFSFKYHNYTSLSRNTLDVLTISTCIALRQN